MVKIYGAVDFAAAAALALAGIPAPPLLLQACAFVLFLKGMASFIPLPIYMPSLLMCGSDILAAALLALSPISAAIKAFLILMLLFKSIPGLILSLFGK